MTSLLRARMIMPFRTSHLCHTPTSATTCSALGESPGYSQRHLWRPQPYKSPGRKTSTGTPQLIIDNRLARIPLPEVFQIVVAHVSKEDCGELHIPDDLYGTRIDKKLCEHDTFRTA